ncbi:MAG TPA: D-alanyl-D-alanine carboxypeptidase/D-alanyl-D-alanine-endopeptidase, partial [Saprospiraceae bacterium]|nr:D-alanyl-D-alanine carboxypeptidase/D-alanyl-D-alanine-endopeptidase [Saprospiraceae bacterium]
KETEYSIYFYRKNPEGGKEFFVKPEPAIEKLTFDNYVTVAGRNTGDQAYIFGGQGFFHKIIKGTVPRGKGEFVIRGSMPNPPSFFAETLKKALDQAGISAEGAYVKWKIEEESLKILGAIASPPLSTLVSLNNAFSINLYSEAFLKTLAKDGTRKDGIKRIYEHLQSEGLNVNGLLMVDGCGLSLSNAVAPEFFTSFLLHYLKKWEKKPYHTTLPRPGNEGTMKYFLNGSKAGTSMWVKSGYISGVLSYAGWMENEKGKRVIFSIMVNHIDVPASNIRKNIELLLENIYYHSN